LRGREHFKGIGCVCLSAGSTYLFNADICALIPCPILRQPRRSWRDIAEFLAAHLPQCEAANEPKAARGEHPRRGAVAIGSMNGHDFATMLERVIERGGKGR